MTASHSIYPWESKRAPDFALLTDEIRAFVQSMTLKPDSHVDGFQGGASAWPRISIVTPSYNQAGFLEQTIRSVLNQGYPNLEYIVLDGGSTDGSVDIIKKYEPFLAHWETGPDGGQAAAIAKGFRMATGELIGFQNSDDLYLPGAFRALAQAAMRDPRSEIFTGDTLLIDTNGAVYDLRLSIEAGFWVQLTLGNQFHNQSMLWRRSLVDRVGPLRAEMAFSFDYEFFLRCLDAGSRVHHVGSLTGAFRAHGDAKSSTMLDTSLAESTNVRREYAPWYAKLVPGRLAKFGSKLYKAAWHLSQGQGWYLVRRRRHPVL